MKKLILIIVAFIAQNTSYCSAQIRSKPQTLVEQRLNDTLIKTNFNNYLDFLLAYKSDTTIQVDTSLNFKINYVTSHRFDFEQDFQDTFYADSLKIICISNPEKVQDSIIKLNFLWTDTAYISYTNLWEGKSNTMKVFTFPKLNPMTGEPYNGSASFYLDAEISRVLSFNSGQYLIIREMMNAS